jgi:hypothetical protein
MTGTQDPDEDFRNSGVDATFTYLTTQQQYKIITYARDNAVTIEEAVETVLGDGRTDRRKVEDETPGLYLETLSADYEYTIEDIHPITVQHMLDNFSECWRLVNAAHGIIAEKGQGSITDEEWKYIRIARQRLDARLRYFDEEIHEGFEILGEGDPYEETTE